MPGFFHSWKTNETCPQCQHHHGYNFWSVMNSSVTRPLRCRHCHQFFHQLGLGVWFLFSLFFPGGLLFLVHWLPGVLFMLGSILLAGIFIRLRYPLACGPRYG